MEVFKPRYPLLLKASFIFFALAMIIVIPTTILQNSYDLKISGSILFSILIIFSAPFIFIKSIEFSNTIKVNRYLYPGYSISYDEIEGYSLTRIFIKGKRPILLQNMKNYSELIELIKKYKKTINNNELVPSEKAIANEKNNMKAISISVIISFVITLLIYIFRLNPPNIDGKLFGLIIWLIIYFMSIFVISKLSKIRSRKLNKNRNKEKMF